MAPPARIDYKAAMRSAIDARHQSPGERGVKPAGATGTEQHRKGAGIGNEQNRLPVTEAGGGAHSGSKGGPADHPLNHLAPTGAGTGTGDGSTGIQGGPAVNPIGGNPPAGGSRAPGAGESVDFSSNRGGAEHGDIDNTVAGPRAVGEPGEAIPHAGQGNDGRGVGYRAAAGGPVTHPQNHVASTRAGQGNDGHGVGFKAAPGGPVTHPQNRVLLVKSKHNSDPGGEQPKKSLAGAIKRPGALTRAVGGKPSAEPGKVRNLEKRGTPLQKKQAAYYLNVLAGH